MSENLPPDTTPEFDVEPKALPTTVPTQPFASAGLSHVVTFFAAGLAFTFFIPWLNILFVKPSGFDFAKEGGNAALLWALPLFALLSVLSGIVKQSQKAVSILAGLVPLIILGYALSKDGPNILSNFEPGAWAAVVLGVLLLLFSAQLSEKK